MPKTTKHNEQPHKSPKKLAYIHEVDFMRALTAFTVVAIHSLSYTGFLITSYSAGVFAALIGHYLHYNRELFMFISGVVLTYRYYETKRFPVRNFWRSRFMSIFIPYVVWSIAYVAYLHPGSSPLGFISNSAVSVVKGNASIQLYYILLALQFYALFPVFILLMRKVAKRPWWTFGISLALQLGLTYVGQSYLQSGPLSHTEFANLFVRTQDRLIIMYEFFFVLGSVVAVHFNRIRDFIRNHGTLIVSLTSLSIAVYGLYYYFQIDSLHESPVLAATVLQPSVVLYSIAIIAFIGWLAIHWARKRPFGKFVHLLSDLSFGVFFVHIFILDLIMAYLFPLVPYHQIPLPFITIGVLILSFSISSAICYVFYKVPYLGWAIGRSKKRKERTLVAIVAGTTH